MLELPFVCTSPGARAAIRDIRGVRDHGFAVRKLKSMDWDRIRIFLEVARTGQILGAARRLGVNHATVARQLTALEQELKTQLVERRTTGCVLRRRGPRCRGGAG